MALVASYEPLQVKVAQKSLHLVGRFWDDGRVGSTGTLFPQLDNCTGRICPINYFGTLDSDENLQVTEDSDGIFWLIVVKFSSKLYIAATHPPPSAMWQELGTCYWSSLHTHILWKLRWQNWPCPPNTGDMCTDGWLLVLILGVQRGGRVVLHLPHCCNPFPLQICDFQEIKESVLLFPLPSFFTFPL